ncbi:ACP phosphodiesterase [Halomonas sp. McH1-25]|uniref:acyl carrier protein phosphodiesterase n=1 Tax=unclassified Halomonas TaxID=2609666 RepID=UPI001EF52278|nr:ACP phosphodiesterase [Halomonas sp. McH1-25]MCP1343768.1 ACP phosphodiesterase [Halomonas sp. FL8]MCP1361747.1 ACP phosphodiesterase [Halomonas sp. BBD45]MCP1366664.1 ACP phosphodiesterase [Halomonas sp. BBD48]
MNFLAHALLAKGGSDDFLFGNLIADGVKGSDLGAWSDDVANGIRHHRRVDATVDIHPEVLAARARAPGGGRRFAGVALDMVWDHFLARDLEDDAIIERTYRVLGRRHAPARLGGMVPAMLAQDWLRGYADFEFTCKALAGLGRRLSGPNRLEELVPWLKEDYTAMEDAFHRLWPDISARLSR